MDTFTLDHAKEHLEVLVERARRGEDVRILDPRLGAMRLVILSVDPAMARLGCKVV